MIYKKLIDNYLIPNKFLQVLWVNAAILLRLLLLSEKGLIRSWIIEEGGFFYQEKSSLIKDTWLKRSKIDWAKKKLEELWIIETKLWEWKKMFFNINNKNLNLIFFPDINDVLWRQEFLDLFESYSWYTSYNLYVSHIIWAQEAILLEYLIKKEYFYKATGKTINWFFYRSNSAIKNDLWFSIDKQNLSIKKLKSQNIIDVKYWKNNTRYFAINKLGYREILLKWELEIKESWKSLEVESWKSLEVENSFINPFKESWKSLEVKVEKSYTWVEKPKWESIKSIENNNNITSINNNNNTRLLLLDIWIFEKKVDEIMKTYTEEEILRAIKYVEWKEGNIPGYIIACLEDWYNTITLKDRIKYKKEIQNKYEEEEIEKEKREKEKNNEIYKKIEQWKKDNKDLYNKFYEQEKNIVESKFWRMKKADLLIESKVNFKIKKDFFSFLTGCRFGDTCNNKIY